VRGNKGENAAVVSVATEVVVEHRITSSQQRPILLLMLLGASRKYKRDEGEVL
jgi:hypothetical protein